MSMAQDNAKACESVEQALDAADSQAGATALRYSHDDVFDAVREELRGGKRRERTSPAARPSFGMARVR